MRRGRYWRPNGCHEYCSPPSYRDHQHWAGPHRNPGRYPRQDRRGEGRDHQGRRALHHRDGQPGGARDHRAHRGRAAVSFDPRSSRSRQRADRRSRLRVLGARIGSQRVRPSQRRDLAARLFRPRHANGRTVPARERGLRHRSSRARACSRPRRPPTWRGLHGSCGDCAARPLLPALPWRAPPTRRSAAAMDCGRAAGAATKSAAGGRPRPKGLEIGVAAPGAIGESVFTCKRAPRGAVQE